MSEKRGQAYSSWAPHWTHLVVLIALEVHLRGEVTSFQALYPEGLGLIPGLPIIGYASPDPLPTGDRWVLSGTGA